MTRDLAGLQQTLGEDYVLERELGRGGMGTVYLARDNRLARPVAIKILLPELSRQADLRERFLRETRVAASFSHPNIVPVHAIETRGETLAFVMGYIDGETLGARVRRAGPLSVTDAARILQEVAWALSYAHGRGVVHRDVKPDNILIERATGRALVTDFGIARAVTGGGEGSNLTRVGEVVGTPEFMSPEQSAGDVVDGRSDLYSLGIVGYFALTGGVPFEAATPTALLAMHLTRPAPSVAEKRGGLPDALVDAVDRCLAKNPEARWNNGESLAAALDTLRRSAPEIAPPVRIFMQRFSTAVFVILLMLIAMGWMVKQREHNDDWQLILILVGACVWGFILQLRGRVRTLVMQGFRYRDVHAGAAAIVAEESAARDALRNTPGEMERRRRRIRIGLACLAWGIAGFMLVTVAMRIPIPGKPGQYRVDLPGAIVAITSLFCGGIGFSLLVSDPLKPNPFIRVQASLWRGPLGRVVFRLGAWNLVKGADTSTGAATAITRATLGGAQGALRALPRDRQRELAGLDSQLRLRESEIEALAKQERELGVVLADVGDRDEGPTAVADRERTRTEISALIDQVRARRETLSHSIERARLELLRFRAGLGNADSVRGTLRE